ncbi:glutaredoxin family protein [Sphaerotilus montanus]|jgi:glutaredoxin|uniref:Glutaredoxin n=1 Tax=Sphaerotilus montanus TaxID=522889 RepID=A0A7Y9UI27_9BURK|nr:glutaredoxin family protein [Sphaerotilus montanus]MBP8271736.1 glutaredoxin family protein [Sphaerotilus sp.]NYG31290.1 glutaredoxin [Sphaerotilus montanus]NZD55276.1 glutaredoxin family protein [Sphaerotilus montanus]
MTAPSNAPTLWQRLGRGSAVSVVLVGVLAWGVGRVVQTQVRDGQAETLRTVARPGDIRMLSSVSCIFCTKARQYLTEHRIPFEECLIERDPVCLADYKRLGASGTPTLLVRGQRQLGFDPLRVTAALGG